MDKSRRWVGSTRIYTLAILAVWAAPAFARQPQLPGQESPSPVPSVTDGSKARDQKPQDQKPQERKPDQEDKLNPQTGTSNDRLFYALPNFLSVPDKPLPPLSAGQKFKVVARGAFDYVEFPWYGFLAGISQAQNSEPGYGQGAAGYGKRYGAAFADGTIENFMTAAVMASLLRQDPRFYQSGRGSFWHRAGYAVSRIFITRSDSGHPQFNFSEVFGSAIAAGISTYSYHPHSDRNFGNTASVWASEIGYDTITIVVKEFWPDIRRKLSHKPKDPPNP